MYLYLVRHGVAAGAGDDPPLTDKGKAEVQRLASFLARGGMKPKRVIHSPLQRARQTALLLAAVVGPVPVIEEAENGLFPEDSTAAAAAAAEGWREDVMLVGHMPHMGRLAAHLLTGSDAGVSVAFERGAVICLDRPDAGDVWGLSWSVSPRLIGQ